MNSIFVKESGAIRHLVTPHFVQAVFGSKNGDKRLKFYMQPPIVVLYPDLGSLTFIKKEDFAEKLKTTFPCCNAPINIKFSQNVHIGPHHPKNLCISFFCLTLFMCYPSIHPCNHTTDLVSVDKLIFSLVSSQFSSE